MKREENIFSFGKNARKLQASLIFAIAWGCLFSCCNLNHFLSLFELGCWNPFSSPLCQESRVFQCLTYNFFLPWILNSDEIHNEKINFWIIRLSETRVTKNVFSDDFVFIFLPGELLTFFVETSNRLNLKSSFFWTPRILHLRIIFRKVIFTHAQMIATLRLPSTPIVKLIAAISHRVVHFTSSEQRQWQVSSQTSALSRDKFESFQHRQH